MQNNTWLEYPQNQPSDNQKFDEFLVAYQNPYFIKKNGFNNKVSRYRLEIMTWTGNGWMNCNHHNVTHFQILPSLPEE